MKDEELKKLRNEYRKKLAEQNTGEFDIIGKESKAHFEANKNLQYKIYKKLKSSEFFLDRREDDRGLVLLNKDNVLVVRRGLTEEEFNDFVPVEDKKLNDVPPDWEKQVLGGDED